MPAGWLPTPRIVRTWFWARPLTARLYFGHAIEDKSMPAEAIEKLNQPSKPGEATMRVKSTKAHTIAGPFRTVRSITSLKPNGRLRS